MIIESDIEQVFVEFQGSAQDFHNLSPKDINHDQILFNDCILGRPVRECGPGGDADPQKRETGRGKNY